MGKDDISALATPAFPLNAGPKAMTPRLRERLSLSVKRSLLKTPLEPLAWFFIFGVAPLVRVAVNPALASPYMDNRFLFQSIGRIATPEMRCIDVGAHIGLFLRAFEIHAPRGRHLAVEPLAWKARALQRKFPDVEVLACALADRPGRSTFVEELERSAFSGLSAHRMPSESAGETREIEVDVRTLDEIALKGPRVGLIKLDAEGAECAILRGGAGLIARDRPAILFECGAPESPDPEGPTAFDALAALGYRIFTVRNFVLGGPPLARDAFNYCRRYPALTFNFAAIP